MGVPHAEATRNTEVVLLILWTPQRFFVQYKLSTAPCLTRQFRHPAGTVCRVAIILSPGVGGASPVSDRYQRYKGTAERFSET